MQLTFYSLLVYPFKGLWGSLVSYGLWEPETPVQIRAAPLDESIFINAFSSWYNSEDRYLHTVQGS